MFWRKTFPHRRHTPNRNWMIRIAITWILAKMLWFKYQRNNTHIIVHSRLQIRARQYQQLKLTNCGQYSVFRCGSLWPLLNNLRLLSLISRLKLCARLLISSWSFARHHMNFQDNWAHVKTFARHAVPQTGQKVWTVHKSYLNRTENTRNSAHMSSMNTNLWTNYLIGPKSLEKLNSRNYLVEPRRQILQTNIHHRNSCDGELKITKILINSLTKSRWTRFFAISHNSSL